MQVYISSYVVIGSQYGQSEGVVHIVIPALIKTPILTENVHISTALLKDSYGSNYVHFSSSD